MANDRRARNKERSQQAKAARQRAIRRQRRKKTVAIVAVLALVLLGIGVATNGLTTSKATSTSPAPAPCPKADGSSAKTTKFEKAPPMCIDPKKTYTADFDTSEGHVVVALDTKKTPNTTNNFVVLALYHYYDGTSIFRINTGIDIIQGGSPNTEDSSDSPGYSIVDEGKGYTYKEGDLVMARTDAPNSAGSQFFLATGPNVSNLNSTGTYVNFGHATSGIDVLHKIKALFQASGGSDPTEGKPNKPVTINKVTITKD